ncbi:MAG: WD40 repeat domain-containing protein [Gemmataceae bacterium]
MIKECLALGFWIGVTVLGLARQPKAMLKGDKGLVLCVAFSLDGKTLASESFDKTIKLWDVSKWTAKRRR